MNNPISVIPGISRGKLGVLEFAHLLLRSCRGLNCKKRKTNVFFKSWNSV